MVTFHPSFEYENFIEGISVKTTDDKLNYYNKDGVLKDICYRALKNLIENNLEQLALNEEITLEGKQGILDGINGWETCYSKYKELENKLSWDYCDNFVLIIDEINRGDISKVFGEVITLLENDKRIGSSNEQVVRLPFTQERFGIPKNIYILATMNTSDRSISMMDIALRRRFSFTKCNPKLDLVNELYTFIPTDSDTNNLLSKSVKAIKSINKKISSIRFIGPDKLIGHSYLMVKDVLKDSDIVSIWSKDILPLLDEYFVGEYEDMIDLLPTWIIDEDSNNILDVTPDKIIELIEILANENE